MPESRNRQEPPLFKEDDPGRYEAAVHAMQSAVAWDHQAGGNDGSPKHLRVGVNAAMCDHTALVKLLMDKGIITEAEYFKAIADEMEAEVARYKERLGLKHPGVKLDFA